MNLTAIKKGLKNYKLEIIMILPLVAYILGFTLTPVLRSIMLGFQDPQTGQFTLEHYRYLFNKADFIEAFLNTIGITAVGLTIEMSLGLVLALILNRAFRGKGFFRSIFLIPMGVPTIVSGVVMTYIFGTTGYLNELLYRIGLIDLPITWTGGGLRTIFVVALADTWKVTPLITLLLLAGLQSIPKQVYEAANIDGASTWQTFRYVTLPLLKPSITMALILRAIDAFRIFELPLVLAGQTTPVLATYAYQEYNLYNNINASGAASTILLVIILLFVVAYLKVASDEGGLG
ncbi:permease component of ABC-type sugar transporter [Halobacteroides halobius DSM 5150]|uniref:Permease component of ABC-type sugar transporter n=2 Tax=Halobacteroides TaxID=42417 RepID=L0K902_HALHC|nr:sugar ABC transporter permease [Halobacteroides halobius]AGB41496.1 permease component of ABC-type sugar transporter [Halobacteroides halobius DSM 5150]